MTARLRLLTMPLLALLAASCNGGVGLTVDVLTDYVAGEEFATVRTEISGAPFTSTAVVGSPTTLGVSTSMHFLAGARVAEARELGPGTYFVRVSLITESGVVLARRVTEVHLTSTFSMTSVISRSCGDTHCPPDGSPSLIACNGGTCVDPRCTPQTPELCGDAACEDDSDCHDAPSGECTRAVCEGGACLYGADDDLCGNGERCNATFACVATVARDAGLGDAGMCTSSETACTDGRDEDCDGETDCADTDCGGAACDDGNACTYGDACASGACAGTAISCASDGCTDRACNGTATCTINFHGAGSGCGDDGNSCTSEACDGAGNCTHPNLAFLTGCIDDGNGCTWDLCDGGGTCVHGNWDGHATPFGRCCGGGLVDLGSDPNNCGACGIHCASGSCDAGSCVCGSDAECQAQGYGGQATCYLSRCQCVCNGDSFWRGQCEGECAGGATCDQTDGLNHCFYP